MIYIISFIIIFFVLLKSIINTRKTMKYIGDLYGVVKNDGLGNRIAGIPGTLVLSLLSKRKFHSIFFM